MNRKLLGGSLAVVLGVVAVWLFWLRDSGDAGTPKSNAGSARAADVKAAPAKQGRKAEIPASSGTSRWLLDVDPEGPLRLEGQVLSGDGDGVGGATVWLSSVPPRKATTDDDGTFAFDKVVGRTYSLRAKSGDQVGGPVTYKLTQTSDPVVIRMTEGAAVTVTVQDDAKQPVSGALVSAFGFDDDEDEEESDRDAARTDASGKATVKPVSPGYVAVRAKAEGYAPGSAFTTVGSAGAAGQLTITLRRGVAVSGKVIDESGAAVAEARVSIDRMWGGDVPLATTNDKGEFSIPAVPPGTHVFAAVDGERAPARSASVTVADRPVSGVEIKMQAGGIVSGTVVDIAGKPAPFATVRVAGAGDQMWQIAARQATTDERGAFTLRGLSRTKLQARAESDIAASKIADVDLTTEREAKDVKLVLDVTGSIAGVVVDEAGAPVPEVQVNSFPDFLAGASTDGLALANMSSATTDGAGAFTIYGLPDGDYRVWASRSANTGGMWGQQGVPAKTGDKAVRVVLAAEGGLKGKVVLKGSSTPPKLVTVQIGFNAPTPANEGVFEIKNLTPGSYDVTFRGVEFAETVRRDIKVDPGKTTDLGTMTVDAGRRVTGTVVDGNGTPVAGARVKVGEMLWSVEGGDDNMEAIESMQGMRSATSADDGTFTIIGIPEKATNIAAQHETRGSSPALALPAGTQNPSPVRLVLRGYGSISGVVTSKGKPLGNVTVSHSSKTGGAQASFATTDDNGAFTMAKVPEGEVVLQVMQSKMMSMKSTSSTATVTAGKETKVTIDVPVGDITLTVNVKPAAGQKVDAAQVFLFSGTVVIANAKQLTDQFMAGGAQGMKFWFGAGKPAPAFEELLAGEYSVCTIPITGDMQDPKFLQRLQENMEALKVYCRQARVPASPKAQSLTHEVPAMAPLPTPT